MTNKYRRQMNKKDAIYKLTSLCLFLSLRQTQPSRSVFHSFYPSYERIHIRHRKGFKANLKIDQNKQKKK
jgi:hypothetical protein